MVPRASWWINDNSGVRWYRDTGMVEPDQNKSWCRGCSNCVFDSLLLYFDLVHAAGCLDRGSCCRLRCVRRCADGDGQCLAGGRLERGASGHPDLCLCLRLPLQCVARTQRARQTHSREAAPHGEHPGVAWQNKQFSSVANKSPVRRSEVQIRVKGKGVPDGIM